MSEEAKRIGSGVLVVKPSSDDRKSSPVEKKVIIKSADMKEDMQKQAVDIAVAAFEGHNVEKGIAEKIKKEFDKTHGPTWHCIVGKNFGSGWNEDAKITVFRNMAACCINGILA